MCLILSAVGRFIEKFTNASLQNILLHEAPLHKISSVTSMSQWFLSYSLYCCCFISAYSFHNYLSLYGSWQKKLSLQSVSKRFPSFGPPANGNKSNTKKILISPKSKLNGNFTSLISNPEKF